MPERLTPRARQIVAAAREILEDEGLEELTMRRIAERLGIRAPSLYKHFPDKASLEAAVISDGFEEQAAVFERAVEGSAEPLADIAAAYRLFARAHPHLYRLMTDQELRRDLLAPGSRSAPAALSTRPRAGTRTARAPRGPSPTA